MTRERMTKGPLRRAQLIAPFGVGAMVVVRDGISLIAAGLDHWFRPPGSGEQGDVNPQEYMVEEWRLEKELGVSHFRLPPDYRERRRYGPPVPNAELTIPYLRFPTWHVCTYCHYMEELTLTIQGTPVCSHCLFSKNKRRRLIQVPFVAICENGHMQDFPWRQWVHNTETPTCDGRLTLRSTGGATLAAQRVKCTCGADRTLAQIIGTDLRVQSNDNGPLLCEGHRPWLAEPGPGVHACGQPLRGSLRSASNVYFAQVRSSIYLPQATSSIPQDLLDVLHQPKVSALLTTVGTAVTPAFLRQVFFSEFRPYTDERINQALLLIRGEVVDSTPNTLVSGDDPETSFRRAEFNVLSTQRDEDLLKLKSVSRTAYREIAADYFSQIMLVDKLRETRVLVGFSRIHAEGRPHQELRGLMRRQPLDSSKDWLPAYVVFGEGIFLQLDEARLQVWEGREDVKGRVERLQNRYEHLRNQRGRRERTISARFILVHTLAHLLMNRLTFECGYSSASLRERLYVSNDQEMPMAGLLVYTAAGDAEGTMGGLVRMGKPGAFEPILLRALQSARWCSADPVCMEVGRSIGQGPNSMNLAACHSCGLVPETACEEFNMFLDRALVIGELSNPDLGFFRL